MNEKLDTGDMRRQLRKDLRESLRGKNKAERQTIVRAYKTERPIDYRMVSGIQKLDRKNYISERHLKRLVENVHTPNDLINAVNGLPPWYQAEGIVHGSLMPEHVLKQLDFSIRYKTDVLIQSPALKEAFRRCVPDFSSEQISDAQYSEYLQEKFPDLKLSEPELVRVHQKLPIDVWCTIDSKMESPVLLANAQERLFTSACCSGHDMDKEKPRAYMTIRTNDPEFIRIIKQSDRSRDFLNAWNWKKLGSFTARSPHDTRDVPFEKAEKGWTFDIFEVPTRENKETFYALSPEERRREREVFILYLIALFNRYRQERM